MSAWETHLSNKLSSGNTNIWRNTGSEFEAEYAALARWSFSHVRDNENGVGASRGIDARLRDNGIDARVLGNLVERDERKQLAALLAQPIRHFSSELRGNVPPEKCAPNNVDCFHTVAIDTAAQEPLFFSWLFQQRRLVTNAIAIQSLQYANSQLYLSWETNEEREDDSLAVWLNYADSEEWLLLQTVTASRSTLTVELGDANAARCTGTLKPKRPCRAYLWPRR